MTNKDDPQPAQSLVPQAEKDHSLISTHDIIVIILVIVLVGVVTVIILALVGPAVGNVFSNGVIGSI
jgi:hypothetical protein